MRKIIFLSWFLCVGYAGMQSCWNLKPLSLRKYRSCSSCRGERLCEKNCREGWEEGKGKTETGTETKRTSDITNFLVLSVLSFSPSALSFFPACLPSFHHSFSLFFFLSFFLPCTTAPRSPMGLTIDRWPHMRRCVY